MTRKKIILALFIYLLVLFQTSFFVPFQSRFSAPYLVLLFLFFLIFFEHFEGGSDLFTIFAAGFFLDFFHQFFLGTSILILLIDFLCLKMILKNFKEPNLFLFLLFFVLFVSFYQLVVFGLTHLKDGFLFFSANLPFLAS